MDLKNLELNKKSSFFVTVLTTNINKIGTISINENNILDNNQIILLLQFTS